MTAAEIQLRREVMVVRRDHGVMLLHVPTTHRTLRVSATTETLLPALVAGTTLDALVDLVGRPAPEVRPVLTAFVDKLRNAGMLAGTEAGPAPPTRIRLKPLVDVNPLTGAIARPLRALPSIVRAVLAASAIAFAIAGFVALAWSRGLPRVSSVVYDFDVFALVWLFIIHIPVHELGHAIAARVAGIRVSSAGVLFGRLGIPVPYVLTTEAFRLRERRPRIWISAGGPFVDLVASGAAAWLALEVPGAVGHAAGYFVFLGLVTFLMNLNPFVPSDGSHILQAVLDDDGVRAAARGPRRAGLTTPRAIRIYRAACTVYVAVWVIAILEIWSWS